MRADRQFAAGNVRADRQFAAGTAQPPMYAYVSMQTTYIMLQYTQARNIYFQYQTRFSACRLYMRDKYSHFHYGRRVHVCADRRQLLRVVRVIYLA